MAILVESGRAAVATAILAQPIYLAWGEGDAAAWAGATGGVPTESPQATGLIKEVGRRIATTSGYCRPATAADTNPGIIVDSGKFVSVSSNTPTKYLYLRFAFDFTDGIITSTTGGSTVTTPATIRELGVFVNTVVPAGSPAYIDAAQMTQPGYEAGQLLVLENISGLLRSSQIRQQFEFVIQF